MNRILSSILITISLLFLLSGPVLAVSVVPEGICNIPNARRDNPACQQTVNEDPISKTIGNVTRFIAGIIGAVAVIMIIYGGFRYITSGGDSNAVASARKTITWAAIGLVVTVLAAVIVQFVVNNFIT